MKHLLNKFREHRDWVVNAALNLTILYLLFTVWSGVQSIEKRLDSHHPTNSGTLQPIVDEELLKRQILNLVIQKLQQAQSAQ